MAEITKSDIQHLADEGFIHKFWVVDDPKNGWHKPGWDHYVIYPTSNCEWNDERIHLLISNSRKKSYFYKMSYANRYPIVIDGASVISMIERPNDAIMSTIKNVLQQYVKQLQ